MSDRRQLATLLAPGSGSPFALWDRFTSGTLTDGRRCRPGPGTLGLITDVGTWTIAGGAAAFDATAASPGELVLVPQPAGGVLSRAQQPSLALAIETTTDNGGVVGLGPSSDDADVVGSYLESGVSLDCSVLPAYVRTIGRGGLFAAINDIDHLGLQVHPSIGCYLLGRRDSLGARYYLLGWIPDDGSDTPVWFIGPGGEQGSIDNLQVTRSRRWAISTLQNLGAPVVNTVYAGQASLVADIGFTLASLVANDKIELRFRRIDADNFWRVRLQTNAGGTAASLLLDEVVATVSTTRATFANVLTGAGEVYAQVRAIVGDTITLNYRLSQHGVYEDGTVYSPAATLDAGTGLQVVRSGTSGTAANLMAWSTGPY